MFSVHDDYIHGEELVLVGNTFWGVVLFAKH